ncbi:MAG: nuclear transport factor 2 family protein [Gemmatimonadota bacterium]
MHPNAELIARFYIAFGKRDPAEMISCYHPDIAFSDPVFPDLRGARAGAMWQMLCERAEDLSIKYRNVDADDRIGRAQWEAWYTFSATGRSVHNRIEAQFVFRDGRIIQHRDSFSFWAWSAQALGTRGVLLGWSSLVKNRVRAQAGKGLEAFVKRSGVAQP